MVASVYLSEKNRSQLQIETELQARLDQLVAQIALGLSEQQIDKQLVFHQERPGKPPEELLVGQDGRWRLRDYDPDRYPEQYILPAHEKMHVVYAHLTDPHLQALDEKMHERWHAVATRMNAKEARLQQPGLLYDAFEEALDKIVDFYSDLAEKHREAHKAVYLQALIGLLEEMVNHPSESH